ncbi:uncharacterized protein [Rutidosis leptorrhynchoides]|uniref:uncharacterized protein n=1 Tax=Rutidosis leptorrhynchoides TaxID=125765 RepID=UPI003A998320
MKCKQTNEDARQLTYVEFPTKFVWNKDTKVWTARKRFTGSIGRIHLVSPQAGELFYLRILLNKVKGPKSYEDIRTVGGKICSTFKHAYYKMSLLDDDQEYIDGLKEANHWGTSHFMRNFFAQLLMSESLSRQIYVFEKSFRYLSVDIIQHWILGKTFLWKTLSAALRSKGQIFFNVASSGIAALLLPGGRIAHSRFAIPSNPHDVSFCTILPNSNLARLIQRAKLIIWDKAPMVNRICFETLDRSLCDICRSINPNIMEIPFGGKIVVFKGYFHQILPVITRKTREQIVSASLNSSYLWDHYFEANS